MISLSLLLASHLHQRASPPILLSWRNGQLCVPVEVGALSMWFLLDTGCARSFLTRKAYARLEAAGSKPADDGTLSLDGVRVGDYPIGKVALGEEDEAVPVEEPVDGFLGSDLLQGYQVELDLRERTLRLWPAGARVEGSSVAPPEVRLQVPFEERAEGWSVPVEVGNLTVPMVLDTGASATFVHTDVAAFLRGARKAKGSPPAVPFYDGLHQVRTYSVPDVGLGGASFGARTIGVASVSRMVGLLGRDLLAPLKILLNYPGETATFTGVSAKPSPLFDGPRVILPNDVIDHWPRGVVANAPAGCSYDLPSDYRQVFNRDDSVTLVPPRSNRREFLPLRWITHLRPPFPSTR